MARSLADAIGKVALEDDEKHRPRLRGLDYRKKIGKGGFATVWKFFDPEEARDVAVKRFSVQGIMDTHAAGVINNGFPAILVLNNV